MPVGTTNIDITEENPEVVALSEQTEVIVSPVEDSPVMVTVEVPDVSASEEVIEVVIQDSPPIQVIISESVVGSGGVPDITDIPLTVTRVYAEVISALKAVRAINSTEVVLGNESTFPDAKILGISLSSGVIGFSGAVSYTHLTLPTTPYV